ncbi:MAG: DUF3386 family protein [Blastopirellula sp. JB062]
MTARAIFLLLICAGPLDAAESNSDATTAAQMLADARDSRITWNGMPGFTAELVVSLNGRKETGKLDVTASGDVAIDGITLKEDRSVGRALQSLIAHRFRDEANELGEEANFDPHDSGTALGKLISQSGGAMESQTRVQDGGHTRSDSPFAERFVHDYRSQRVS